MRLRVKAQRGDKRLEEAGGFRAENINQNSETLRRSEQRDAHSFNVSKDKTKKAAHMHMTKKKNSVRLS